MRLIYIQIKPLDSKINWTHVCRVVVLNICVKGWKGEAKLQKRGRHAEGQAGQDEGGGKGWAWCQEDGRGKQSVLVLIFNINDQVLQETLMMIPDCHRRIVAAKGELEQLLETEVQLASFCKSCSMPHISTGGLEDKRGWRGMRRISCSWSTGCVSIEPKCPPCVV